MMLTLRPAVATLVAIVAVVAWMNRGADRDALERRSVNGDASRATGPAAPTPSASRCEAVEYRRFDFWLGDWEVHSPDGTRVGENRIELEANGCGLLERWRGAGGGRGVSVSTYDAALGRWTQRWVGDGATLWLEGDLEHGSMVLRGTAPRATPRGDVLDRITWTPLPDGRVRQVWDISDDGGRSWSPIFTGLYSRVEGGSARRVPEGEGYLAGAGGARIFYQVVGAGADTAVVLHGGPGAGIGSVRPAVEPLAGQVVLILFDQRGGGRSELPADTALLDAEYFVEDLEAVRRHFGLERIRVIAHSFGAIIAARYAQRYPERVERMVFHGATGPHWEDAVRVARAAPPSPDTAASNRAGALLQALLAGTAPDPVVACREYEAVGRRLAELRGETATWEGTSCAAPPDAVRYYYRHTAQYAPRTFGRWDFTTGLDGMDAPLLVLHGLEDAIGSAGQHAWAAAAPNGRLLEVSDAGRAPLSDRPDVVLPAVTAFLKGRWPDGAAPPTTNAGGAGPAQQPDTARLAREIPRLMAVGDVPGLALAVIADGRPVWTGAFGVLGDEAGTPVDDRTIFSAASLSKPLFAYVVLRLADRGEFDLDRPLAELIDYPRVTHDPRARAITARLVLSHGTGLPNWGGERLELRFDPGTGFDYSGEGFVFLQRAVEEVTGLSLEALARREAFEPLGMTRSSYVWRDDFEGDAVHGKGWDARFEPVTRYDRPSAAFSLLTTAGDYARFVAAVLRGAGLAERTLTQMLTPVRPAHRTWRPRDADPHVSWALGWGIQSGAAGPAFWHWGDNGRFKAYVIAYPGTGAGVVYFANGDDGLSIAESIVDMVVDDDHWALRWLDYESHDDPARLARKAVERAALDGGAPAAITAYEATRRDPAARLGVAAANRVARFLHAHELDDAARHILAGAVSDHPDSTAAHANLGAALLAAAAYEDAVEAYRAALALGSDDDAARRVAWIQERIAARNTPVSIPEATLRRYAGDYGPRVVRLRDGSLHYRRDDGPEFRLVPLAADLFALDGVETFRVRFAVDGNGDVAGIVGLYIDGRTDETPRTSP